jgi:hypothetical protein
VRDILAGVSQAHARQGLTATETVTFVLSLKQPLFSAFARHIAKPIDGPELIAGILGVHRR